MTRLRIDPSLARAPMMRRVIGSWGTLARRVAQCTAALCALFLLTGHVGNNVEYLVGSAGPYPVQVVIRLPGVIPGLAQVSVQVDTDDVTAVAVQPLYWQAVELAPAPERARLIPGESRLWSADVWLMARGSYGVRVLVDGGRGTGEMLVPVNAVATRTLEMQRTLGMALTGLGLFLVVGMLTIVRAASSDGLLPPGVEPDRKTRRRSWIATGVATVIMALALVGGSAWWGAVDAEYRQRVQRPLAVSTTIDGATEGRLLTLTITEPNFLQGTPLIPDHGKLMHMFLLREPELDVFAHLHPVRVDSTVFAAHLPPLPAGRYRLYADIVRASGFVITLQDSLEIAEATREERFWTQEDPDAAWHRGLPSSEVSAPLPGGGTMTLRTASGRPTAGAPETLQADVRSGDGTPAPLEPYLGMLGHAVVTRADGLLFVHLHPVGTISMAAQEQFERRTRGDTALVPTARPSPDMHAGHAADTHGSTSALEFPFVFPAAGAHRIWIQVRVNGEIQTAVFDLEVAEAP
jgi:hypothetical protein